METENSPHEILKEFLLERVPVYDELVKLKQKGWENPAADDFFKAQRERADRANFQGQIHFFRMMQQIGDELEEATEVISSAGGSDPNVLDICIAPGGYAKAVLKHCPSARICGISLPVDSGGHKVLMHHGRRDPRVTIKFMDVTMLVKEFCATDDIPSSHPDALDFLDCRPYLGNTFDLVFCDGQVLRTHTRGSSDMSREPTRLRYAQLILAFQRIKLGGSLVMLLHRLDSWHNFELLYTFAQFSTIQLFKPQRKHAAKSSFYLVVRQVQPDHPEAERAVKNWKRRWLAATLAAAGNDGTEQTEMGSEDRGKHVRALLEEFGDTFIRLGEPVWRIQKGALSKASYTQ